MKYNLTIKTVFGYNLQGVVRGVAAYEFVISFVVILLAWVHVLENKLDNVPVIGKWGLTLTYGLTFPVTRIIFSIILFNACKSRNVFLLRLCVVFYFVVFICIASLFKFAWNHLHLVSNLPVDAQSSNFILIAKVLSLMYIVFFNTFPPYLIYCFIREVESCGLLNVTLSKLSDKEVQELQTDLLKFTRRRSVNIKDFAIPMSNLQVDEERILGSGNFGTVHKAFLQQGIEMKTVAVKSIKNGSSSTYFKTVLEEFVILAYLGNHENVVKMIGNCTELFAQRKVYLVMEYCKFGSLSNFLKSKRSVFVSFVADGGWTGNSGFRYGNINPSCTINTLHLLQWSYDICKGMEYLEEKKVIHGDLAARNVLLDYRKVAKISDFGFSKKLYENINVIRDDIKLFPWRWMAIESLTDLEFSSKSDMWSFGCTIWEIFSLAEIPFSSHIWDSEFIGKLKSGLQLQRPCNATHDLFALLSECWNHVPEKRPSFAQSCSLRLGEMLVNYSANTRFNSVQYHTV